MLKKAKCRNTSPKQRVCRFLISPVRHHWVPWCGGDRRGAQNRGIFSFHGAVIPSPYRVGTNARKSLVHQEVNRPFVAVYYSYKDSGHASLLAPPSPPPKWKVELKNRDRSGFKTRQNSLAAGRRGEKACQPPFQGLRQHLEKFCSGSWHPALVFSCRCAAVLHNRRLQPWRCSRSHCVTLTKGEAGSPQLQHSSKWFSDHSVQTLAAAAALKGHYPRRQ